MDEGEHRGDRTGVGTRSLFGETLKFDLRDSFPAITTKKLAFKAVVSELLWFLEGSGDERRLAEIHYGKPRAELDDKKTIWTANSTAESWLPKAQSPGDCGKIYGYQWRHNTDQVAELVRTLREDPMSRRHIISAWNPGDIKNMALPPCHVMSQFYVGTDGTLSCQMTQRSCDAPTGLPFNIASYSLLTYMLAQITGLTPKTLTINIGDAHIYENQVEGVHEQLTRTPLGAPTLWLNPNIKNIFDFKMKDVKLMGYQSHPKITFPMNV